jgi:hypothetical protein
MHNVVCTSIINNIIYVECCFAFLLPLTGIRVLYTCPLISLKTIQGQLQTDLSFVRVSLNNLLLVESADLCKVM